MRPPSPALIALLLCAWSAGAVPSSSSIGASPPHPFRRFADRVIQRLFGLPQEPVHHDRIVPLDVPVERNGTSRSLRARYGDEMVLRFTLTTPAEAIALQEASSTLYLDVWEFNEDWADIRLAKDVVKSLLGLLPPSLQASHTPLMRDLSLVEAIADTYPSSSATSADKQHHSYSPRLSNSSPSTSSKPKNCGLSDSIFFNDYQPLSVIIPWMRLLTSYYPTHARLINIGYSYEGREIPAIRLGVHPTNDDVPLVPRKTIIVSGGLHAREWISTSTVNYVLYSLITSYGKSPGITALLEDFDWVFIPTLNPDGYVYTWETDRLWRKNRQPTNLRFCQGLDLDRAFGFHWDGESSRGNPCSESFSGEVPWEGVEAKAFADWARNETEVNNVDIVAFLDLHSYSQQVLYPYSYSCYQDPPALEDLEELALGLAKAMRLSHGGQFYKATSACEGNVALRGKKEKTILPRLETGGGSALDWFYHELHVKYSYQLKLRDTGSYGFLLPKENIVPTGNEVLEAVLYLGRYLNGNVGLTEDQEEEKSTQDAATKEENQSSSNIKPITLVPDEQILQITEDEDYQDEAKWEMRRRRRR